MAKINPFNPNSIVSTSLFAGRHEYVFHIIKKLNQVRNGMPSSFFLYGERGIGKTALAKLITWVAEAKDPQLENLNFLTSYYTVEKNQYISSVLQACLNELTDRMPKSVMDRLSSRLGDIFKNGKFSIGAFSIGVELGTKDSDQETVVLKDLIVSILTNIISGLRDTESQERHKDGVLIIIDEFDNVADIVKCAQLFRGVATTLDVKGLGNVAFLLIGYDRTIENFFAGDSSARRHFDLIQLGTMPIVEAKQVLEKGFGEAGVTYDDGALLANVFVTGGYPHSIQLVGHNLIDVDTDIHIDEQDWDKAIEKTACELRQKDFADMYNFRGKPGLKEFILDILAVKGARLSRAQIKQYSNGKNIYQCLPELIKRGSIKEIKKDDTLRLHSQLFRTSILLHILPKIRSENYLNNLIKEIENKTPPVAEQAPLPGVGSNEITI
jgi:hypothetical protein